MNNLQIYFDGILQNNNDFDGTESVSFVYRKKTDGGESAFSFSPELTVRGAAYDYLVQEIINKPNPKMENIKVLIYDLCCLDVNGNPREVFNGLIEGADVRWCLVPFCEATVTVIDDTPDAQAVKCLKNTFVNDRDRNSDGYDEFRLAPNLLYCDDVKPRSLHEALMIIGIILVIIYTPLIAIISIIGAQDYFNQIAILITRCGNKHLTPYLHSQMSNLCKRCGLALQSSLFDPGGYYHDTVRLDAAYQPGTTIATEQLYNDFNFPNFNGIQFLDELKTFNIEWRVVNNVLQIERKDFFQGPLWFDATLLPIDNVLSLCVEATDIKPYAYAEYEYSNDGVDKSGDEVAKRWSDLVIDWNIPVNPIQVGLYSKKLMYGAAQFRKDFYRLEPVPIDLPAYQFFYPVLLQAENRNAMLLSQGTANFPKLLDIGNLIINGTPNRQNRPIAVVRNEPSQGLKAYNYRWWIKEQPFVDDNNVSHDTAYQRLFCIDDPRNNSIKIRRFTLTVTADCDLVRGISVDKTVRMSIGDGEVEEITYDTTNNSLTIVGKV